MKSRLSLAARTWLLAPLLLTGLALLTPAILKGQEEAGPSVATRLPEPGPTPEIQAPVPEQAELDGGIELWHLELDQVPMVSLTITLPVGAADDPAGKAGLAAMTAALLDEGTLKMDALEISDAFDFLGASFSVSADREASRISLQVLRRNFEPALELLADILLKPALREEDWNRLKIQWINNLRNSQVNPNLIARTISYRIIFGEDHPYAHPTTGYPGSVEGIRLEEARAFYQKYWKPDHAKIVASGAISISELKEALGKHLAGWEPSGSLAPRKPPAYPDRKDLPRVVLHHLPGSSQAVVRLTAPGISRTHPDYEALNLANVIFGGSFTSRLNGNLRVKHGYTYGAGSNFTRLQGPGVFLAAARVEIGATGKALVEFRREFQEIARNGVRPDEASKALATMRGNLIESLQTLAGTTGQLTGLAEAGLPPTHFKAELARYAEIGKDPSGIDEAAKRWMDWSGVTVFLVGDREAVKKALAETPELELGEILEVDIEGRPLEN